MEHRHMVRRPLRGTLACSMVGKNDHEAHKAVMKHIKRQRGKPDEGCHAVVLLSCCLFRCLETLCVLGDLELVDNVLDGTVHKYRKVVHRVVDTMVGHT